VHHLGAFLPALLSFKLRCGAAAAAAAVPKPLSVLPAAAAAAVLIPCLLVL
jgi:hypothetical protein